MRAVVFGAGGFLGRAVVARLKNQGWLVHAIARSPSLGTLVADITQPESLAALRVEADVAINLAAAIPTGPDTLSDSSRMFSVNAIGAAHVAQWAVTRHIPRLVHGSTLVVASRPWPSPLTESAPTTPTGLVAAYAASKLGGELVAGSIFRAASASFLSLRFSALYGPSMAWTGVLPTFIDGALAGQKLTATSGTCADFLEVNDAADAVVAAAHYIDVTGVANVASGVEIRIEDVARTVLTVCGRDPNGLTVKESPETRALVDVTRLRDELEIGPGTALLDGIQSVVAHRRTRPK